MEVNPLKRIESLERRVALLEQSLQQKGGPYGQIQTAEATQNAGTATSGTESQGKEDSVTTGDPSETSGVQGSD